MDINAIKAYAFDKQIQLDQALAQTHAMNDALMKISEMVGVVPGEGVDLNTLVASVGARLSHVEKQVETQG